MVKNALQAQLLKAGLVDNKKQKINKQAHHEQRLGLSNEAEIKANIEKAQQEKVS